MTQENTLPEGYSVITNATVKDLRKTPYDTYELIASTTSPLTGTEIEQRMPLYTTDFNTRKESDDVVAATQANLREALGDDSIVFRATPDESDENDLINWVKAHVGDPIKAIYLHEGKARIAAPRPQTEGGQHRTLWLKKYKPEMGTYNPDEHYLSFFDAQTDEDQAAINALDTSSSKISESTFRGRKSTAFFGTGTIQDVTTANGAPFNTQTKEMSIVELAETISAILSMDAPEALVSKEHVTSDKALAEKLNTFGDNPNDGLYALYALLGGYRYLNNVSEERAPQVKALIDSLNISVVTMYVRTGANKTFQLSANPMRKLDLSRPSTHGLHIEFSRDDFKSDDIMLPLVNGDIIDQNEALQVAKDLNLYNENTHRVELATYVQGMDYLRELFNGKTIRYRSTIADDRGKTEHRLLGSNFISATAPTTEEQVTVEEPVNDTVETVVDMGNPFAQADSEKTEEPAVEDTATNTPTEDVIENPFAIKK